MFIESIIINKISAKNNRKSKQKYYKFLCDFCKKEFLRKDKESLNNKTNYCSRKCLNLVKNECIICHVLFDKKSVNQKICSKKCSRIHIKHRVKEIEIKNAIERKCKFCNKIYKRVRERGGFCGKICASKFYVLSGKYDMWLNHKRQSKDQKEIYETIKKYFQNEIIKYDKKLVLNNKLFYPDILLENKKIIIEFNGTYWHCDPRFYKLDYYHDFKEKTASLIWEEDKKRIENFKNFGYRTFVIWEYDYKTNKEVIIKDLIKEISE